MEPWTLENGVTSGEIGTFPTDSSLVRAQPFLSFPYVSIKYHFSSPVMIQDRNGRCCWWTNRWQASICWFLWFWFRACGTHTSDFLILPIECKCHTMVECSQFIKFTSSRVHWHGSLWINVFKWSSSNPEELPEHWVLLMSKRSSLKRENYFCAILSPIELSPYTAQMFLAALTPLLNSKRRICLKCSIHPIF